MSRKKRKAKGRINNQVRSLEQMLKDRKHRQAPKLGAVSIFTDASHDPETGAGGWAYQIIAPGYKPVKRFGGFKDPLHSIHEGELKAIALAIKYLFYDLGAPDSLTIYSDSVAALDMVDNSGNHHTYREMHKWVRSEIKKRKLKTLSLRHVSAHTDAKVGKMQINAWCDKHAKHGKDMRVLQLQKEQKNE